MSKKPNILWLMADQHNANCIGAYGHANVRTPHLDALCHRGARFNRAYCNNPICGPSRACFLTGQFVKTHGVSGNFIRGYEGDAPNLAFAFSEAGYQTALIGKAHLPAIWVEQGFEHLRFSDLADADPEEPRSCHYFNYLVENGWAKSYDQGMRWPGQSGYGMRSFISEIPQAHCLETWTGNEALEFLQNRDTERPFFLKVSFQRPHDPYSPPPEQANAYVPENMTLPANASDYFQSRFSEKPVFQQKYAMQNAGSGYPFRSLNVSDLQLQMSRHFTLISMIDEQIGRIIDWLRNLGLLDNTLIAYVADHGDFAGEHGLMLKNFGIYESIHRIPFILSGPGIPQGITVEGMAESVDFAPTLLDYAGLDALPQADGHSLKPQLNGQQPSRSHTVCEWDFYETPQKRVHAVRDERYRLVFYQDAPDDGELYDVLADPGELQNLYKDPALEGEKQRLTDILMNYRADELRFHTPELDRTLSGQIQDRSTLQIHKGHKRWE